MKTKFQNITKIQGLQKIDTTKKDFRAVPEPGDTEPMTEEKKTKKMYKLLSETKNVEKFMDESALPSNLFMNSLFMPIVLGKDTATTQYWIWVSGGPHLNHRKVRVDQFMDKKKGSMSRTVY